MTSTRSRRPAGVAWWLSLAAVLLAAGCTPNPDDQVDALYEAEKHGRLETEDVREALQSESPKVRASGAALAGRALSAEEAATLLIGALDDEDSGVRATAASALGDLVVERAAEPLARLVEEDRSTVVRLKATHALRKIDEPSVAPRVAPALSAVDVELRRQAARTLFELANPATLETLLGALEDEDVRVRAWAARALAEIGDPRARPALEALAESDNPLDRGAARNALRKLDEGTDDEQKTGQPGAAGGEAETGA
jgi:HEAT repeat protein